jgi:hypothetical protein
MLAGVKTMKRMLLLCIITLWCLAPMAEARRHDNFGKSRYIKPDVKVIQGRPDAPPLPTKKDRR